VSVIRPSCLALSAVLLCATWVGAAVVQIHVVVQGNDGRRVDYAQLTFRAGNKVILLGKTNEKGEDTFEVSVDQRGHAWVYGHSTNSIEVFAKKDGYEPASNFATWEENEQDAILAQITLAKKAPQQPFQYGSQPVRYAPQTVQPQARRVPVQSYRVDYRTQTYSSCSPASAGGFASQAFTRSATTTAANPPMQWYTAAYAAPRPITTYMQGQPATVFFQPQPSVQYRPSTVSNFQPATTTYLPAASTSVFSQPPAVLQQPIMMSVPMPTILQPANVLVPFWIP
jgi:hypothetical protein